MSKKQKSISPLQAMAFYSHDSQSNENLHLHNTLITEVSENILASKSDNSELIVEIDPKFVRNWKYSDRPSSELGDIEKLAEEFKSLGQQNPCLVRSIENDPYFQYELITGERRWRAAIFANIKLKIIIKNLEDHTAALLQASENIQRKDLSEYAKGMSYAKLIENGVLSSDDLINKLNISKVDLSRLLSFKQIPIEFWNVIKEPSRISARMASEIRALINKGYEYLEVLINLATKIENGKIAISSLRMVVEKQLFNKSENIEFATEVRSKNGRHLFTWRRDTNNNISITFPKDIRTFIDRTKLEQTIKNEIEEQLANIE